MTKPVVTSAGPLGRRQAHQEFENLFRPEMSFPRNADEHRTDTPPKQQGPLRNTGKQITDVHVTKDLTPLKKKPAPAVPTLGISREEAKTRLAELIGSADAWQLCHWLLFTDRSAEESTVLEAAELGIHLYPEARRIFYKLRSHARTILDPRSEEKRLMESPACPLCCAGVQRARLDKMFIRRVPVHEDCIRNIKIDITKIFGPEPSRTEPVQA